MKNDTMKLLESIQNNINEGFGPKYDDFMNMITPEINDVFNFHTDEDGMGDFDIFNVDGNYVGNIYNDRDNDLYEINVKDENNKKVSKKFKTIEEVINFLDNIANKVLDS